MTKTERTYLLDLLQQSELALINVLQDVSLSTFLYQADGKWSMAEIVEHLMITDTGIFKGIQKKAQRLLEEAPNTLAPEVVFSTIASPTRKVKAPEFVEPKGIFKNKEAALQAFLASREAITNFLSTTDLPLEKITFPHFVLGLLNGKGWIAFMAAHCERHVEQMERIKMELS